MKNLNLIKKIKILLFDSKIHKLFSKILFLKIIIFVLFDIFLLALIGTILTNINEIDSFINNDNSMALILIIFSFILVGIRLLTLNILYKNIAWELACVKARVSQQAYQSILEFGSKRYTRAEMNRKRLSLVDGVTSFTPGLLNPLFIISSELLVIVVFIIILLNINLYFSIILFLLVSIYFIFSRYKLIESKSAGNSRAYWEGKRYFVIDSAIDGSQEIFLHNKRRNFMNEYIFISKKIAKDETKFMFVNYSNKFMLESLVMIIIAFTSIYSSYPGIPGSETIFKSLPTLIILSVRIIPSFGKLINSSNSINFAFKPIKKLLKELESNKNEDILSKNSLINFPLKIPSLIVNFSANNYLSYKPFVIEKTKIYRIVGVSGAGKSTYIKAILNLLPYKLTYPNSFNKEYESQLRNSFSKIGYVRQHPYLFNDNALFNITFCNSIEEVDIPKLQKSLITSNCHEFLDLKSNSIYCKNFSGGQIQRIALARELYKKPDILFLDECFSGLPQPMHKKILNNLVKDYKNLTIVFISHVKLDESIPIIEHELN